MLLDAFGDLNWLAVLVAGLAYFVIGALWYTDALMGRQYRSALGLDPDIKGTPEVTPMVVNFVGWIVSAVALALVSVADGADSFADGLVLGLVVAVGLIITQMLVTTGYEGRGNALFKVNAPYVTIGFAVMGVILAVWR